MRSQYKNGSNCDKKRKPILMNRFGTNEPVEDWNSLRCPIKESGPTTTALVEDVDLANQHPQTCSGKMEEEPKELIPLMSNLLFILEWAMKLNGHRISLIFQGRRLPSRPHLIMKP